MIVRTALAAIFFASCAVIAAEVSRWYCRRITPFPDGPKPSTAPVALLVAAAACIGAVLTWWSAQPVQLGLAALVVMALVACWCSDARCGIVPDAFTLVPVGVMLLFAIYQRDWEVCVSAVLPVAFFGGAALLTRGKGMGWGDVKLVALTGAALGAPLALLALPIACVAAVVAQRVVGASRSPMAFAPYIAAVTGIALPLGITR